MTFKNKPGAKAVKYEGTFTPEELEKERWRPLLSLHAIYAASSLGRIRREVGSLHAKAGHLLSLHLGQRDFRYLRVRVWLNGRGHTMSVSKLVAEAWLGPRPDGLEINHKDGDRMNNRPSNLEYVTRRANNDHVIEHGLRPYGEKHHAAKLMEQKVREIRAAPVGDKALAARYGVGTSTIQAIRSRKTWKRVA